MSKKILPIIFILVLAATSVCVYLYIKQLQPGTPQKTWWDNMTTSTKKVVPKKVETPQENTTSTIVTSTKQNNVDDMIRVTNIVQNQEITSPVVIEGEARGGWFFEAQFPVQIASDDGKILGTTVAQAKGEWMTNDFVPFIATVDFVTPLFPNGKIILQKDNPSGLKEHDASLILPITFSQKTVERVSGGCKVTGCSSEVCSETDVVTECTYQEKYICFQKALCARQTDGKCGWTQTKELQLCQAQFDEEQPVQ